MYIKMNVFRATFDTTDIVDYFKQEILRAGTEENDDMTVILSGYAHNRLGFVLKVQNMEKITDTLLAEWRSIVVSKGYACKFTYDFQEGWVEIKCMQPNKKPFLKGINPQLLAYLSVGVFCIYRLWSSDPHQT